jgi:hypothetical protein
MLHKQHVRTMVRTLVYTRYSRARVEPRSYTLRVTLTAYRIRREQTYATLEPLDAREYTVDARRISARARPNELSLRLYGARTVHAKKKEGAHRIKYVPRGAAWACAWRVACGSWRGWWELTWRVAPVCALRVRPGTRARWRAGPSGGEHAQRTSNTVATHIPASPLQRPRLVRDAQSCLSQ